MRRDPIRHYVLAVGETPRSSPHSQPRLFGGFPEVAATGLPARSLTLYDSMWAVRSLAFRGATIHFDGALAANRSLQHSPDDAAS